MINKKFQLYQCCIPVKGKNKGIIIDFQRKTFYIFENEVIDIINKYSGESIYNVFTDFNQNKNIIKKYIKYFLENELIIVSENLENYTDINLDFEKPFWLDTVTIEINEMNLNITNFLMKRVDELGLNCLKIIIKNSNVENIESIFSMLNASKIQYIILYIQYNNKELVDEITDIKKSNHRLMEVVFFNANDSIAGTEINSVSFEKENIESVLLRTVSSVNDFAINLDSFTEAKKYNLSYNRSLYIDEKGNIKKSILDKEIYGNITGFDLKSIVENTDILGFWSTNKDKIEVCKDCEFRYICTDFSIPIKSNNKGNIIYEREIKCNYDPYKNEWVS